MPFQGPRLRTSSALKRELNASASALMLLCQAAAVRAGSVVVVGPGSAL
jgi:hypothetical protein